MATKVGKKETRELNKKLHEEVSSIIKDYLMAKGYEVSSSDSTAYNFKVNGRKCKVNAHQNKNDSVVIEYATDKHHILDAGYDTILYMDTTNPKRNKFYMAPVSTVAAAINNRMGKSPYYTQISRRDVLANSGICIGITEKVFERIEGVEKFEIE